MTSYSCSQSTFCSSKTLPSKEFVLFMDGFSPHHTSKVKTALSAIKVVVVVAERFRNSPRETALPPCGRPRGFTRQGGRKPKCCGGSSASGDLSAAIVLGQLWAAHVPVSWNGSKRASTNAIRSCQFPPCTLGWGTRQQMSPGCRAFHSSSRQRPTQRMSMTAGRRKDGGEGRRWKLECQKVRASKARASKS